MKVFKRVVTILILLSGVTVGAALCLIHYSVRAHCRIAQQAHPHVGDDVAALIDFINAPTHSLQERNRIGVWTLGRLCDPRALPALQANYTGEPCDHTHNLCQHELSKAIRRCGGMVESPP